MDLTTSSNVPVGHNVPVAVKVNSRPIPSMVSVIVNGSGGAASAAGDPNATNAPTATIVPISVLILIITPPVRYLSQRPTCPG